IRPSVLLVDPDPGFRAELADALAAHFDVHQAADGAVALRLAQTLLPAIVITELDLPGIDGFMLARSIKSSAGRLRQTAVVFVSSRTAPREVAYAIAAGARRFLLKPCVPKTVADIATRIAST